MHTDHIKNRNVLAQLGLFVVTLGIYAVYWYYSTLKELHIANGKDEGAGLWTVLALIPIANLFSWWHYSSEADTFTSGKYSSVVPVHRLDHLLSDSLAPGPDGVEQGSKGGDETTDRVPEPVMSLA